MTRPRLPRILARPNRCPRLPQYTALEPWSLWIDEHVLTHAPQARERLIAMRREHPYGCAFRYHKQVRNAIQGAQIADDTQPGHGQP